MKLASGDDRAISSVYLSQHRASYGVSHTDPDLSRAPYLPTIFVPHLLVDRCVVECMGGGGGKKQCFEQKTIEMCHEQKTTFTYFNKHKVNVKTQS